MTLKLTAASFLNGVRSSGLVSADTLAVTVRELRAAGGDINDSQAISTELVRRDLITGWQADKLLQGRHKGFFLGRYRLLKLLGTGQMSAVYLGRHILMDHLCAIKVLPADKVGDTSYLGRFYREAQAVAALNHPNVIRAYDVDKQTEAGTDIHFLVLEYVAGKLLTNLIQSADKQQVDLIAATDIIRQAAEGLSHAHAVNMVHRDIKPDNLLVTDKGDVKILDLGLARFFKTTDEESLTLKHDERVIGTADYLAPEQAIDSHSVDARADIYGLGCTFYCALTGHPPFTEGTLVQRLMAHQSQPLPPVTNDRANVPESLTAILNKMLAKKAADRYQTARELADDLTGWLLDNASDAWKEQHLPMYARLLQRAMLSAQATLARSIETPRAAHSEPAIFANEALTQVAATTTANSESKPKLAGTSKPLAPAASKPKPIGTATSSAGPIVADRKRASSSKPALAAKTPSSQLAETAAMTAQIPPEVASFIGVARRHPIVTALSIAAALALIAVGIVLLRPADPASAKDHSRNTSDSPRTANALVRDAR